MPELEVDAMPDIDRTPDLMERLASAAFESDTRGGHHKGGPWTWHMIGHGGRANYHRLAGAVLDELERPITGGM